jgi:hypothetical protein
MPAVTEEEVKPGLVVHLDTAELRQLGGSSTNAELSNKQDRAVTDPHYFLVLEKLNEYCLAVPLFSGSAPGNSRLNESLKSGLSDKWFGEKSYFSRWQHWRIPISCVAAASSSEESSHENRRGYAIKSPRVLASIAAWQTKNRASYRAL